MNLTGEVDELVVASASSLPRGDRPTPQTKFCGLAAFSASYDAARARPQTCADWFAVPLDHCGFTNSGWLHSFITTNWRTLGKALAPGAGQSANCSIRALLPQDSGSVDARHLLPPVKTCECSG